MKNTVVIILLVFLLGLFSVTGYFLYLRTLPPPVNDTTDKAPISGYKGYLYRNIIKGEVESVSGSVLSVVDGDLTYEVSIDSEARFFSVSLSDPSLPNEKAAFSDGPWLKPGSKEGLVEGTRLAGIRVYTNTKKLQDKGGLATKIVYYSD